MGWIQDGRGGYVLLRVRAPFTTASYRAKWAAFQRWRMEKSTEPTLCPLPQVQIFLVDRNLTLSTMKSYTAAISFCLEGYRERSVFVQIEHWLGIVTTGSMSTGVAL